MEIRIRFIRCQGPGYKHTHRGNLRSYCPNGCMLIEERNARVLALHNVTEASGARLDAQQGIAVKVQLPAELVMNRGEGCQESPTPFERFQSNAVCVRAAETNGGDRGGGGGRGEALL